MSSRDARRGLHVPEAQAKPAEPASAVAADSRRVVVERLQPAIENRRFPIKRAVGETVTVTGDVFADGHDLVAGVLKHRRVAADAWTATPLVAGDNDSWSASFVVTELGDYEYTFEAWVARFGTWLKELVAKAGAQQDVARELLEGAELVQHAASEMPVARTLSGSRGEPDKARPTNDPDENLRLLETADAEARLPAIADMGFDVVEVPGHLPAELRERAGGIAVA